MDRYDIVKKLLETANSKVEDICDKLDNVNLKVYSNTITEKEGPQTALKVYKVIPNREERDVKLVGVLDALYWEDDNTIEFEFYKTALADNSSATFINAAMDSSYEFPTLKTEQEFNTNNLDMFAEDFVDHIKNI